MIKKATIGRFEVEAKEWSNYGKSRIYFTLIENGNRGKNMPQACWDNDEKCFIKCRNRVNARWEHAIKEAFELGEQK